MPDHFPALSLNLKENKFSWKDAPKLLHENRQRALTPPLPEDIPISENTAGKRIGWQKLIAREQAPTVQRTYEQRQFPLLQPPPEIRETIWKRYLRGHQFHVVCIDRHYEKTSRGRLVGIKCSEYPGSFPCVDHDCWERIPGKKKPSRKELRWYIDQFSGSKAKEVPFSDCSEHVD